MKYIKKDMINILILVIIVFLTTACKNSNENDIILTSTSQPVEAFSAKVPEKEHMPMVCSIDIIDEEFPNIASFRENSINNIDKFVNYFLQMHGLNKSQPDGTVYVYENIILKYYIDKQNRKIGFVNYYILPKIRPDVTLLGGVFENKRVVTCIAISIDDTMYDNVFPDIFYLFSNIEDFEVDRCILRYCNEPVRNEFIYDENGKLLFIKKIPLADDFDFLHWIDKDYTGLIKISYQENRKPLIVEHSFLTGGLGGGAGYALYDDKGRIVYYYHSFTSGGYQYIWLYEGDSPTPWAYAKWGGPDVSGINELSYYKNIDISNIYKWELDSAEKGFYFTYDMDMSVYLFCEID